MFSYGYSYANMYDGWYESAVVCAAVGTSNYLLQGGLYSVFEAQYIYWHWDTGGNAYADGDYHGQVNTTVDMHLHSHCAAKDDDIL